MIRRPHNRFVCSVLLATTWLLSSCDGDQPDPQGGIITGNAFSPALIQYTAASALDDTERPVLVIGLPNAVEPPAGRLTLTNEDSGASAPSESVREDGSFVIALSARAGDTLELSYDDADNSRLAIPLDDSLSAVDRPRLDQPSGLSLTQLQTSSPEVTVSLANLEAAPPTVIFNESSGEALREDDPEAIVRLVAEPGQRICVFSAATDGQSSPVLCEQVTAIACDQSCGDVDGDGALTLDDGRAVQEFVVGLISLSPCAQLAANLSGDAIANTTDARLIERVVGGELSITQFVCRPVAPVDCGLTCGDVDGDGAVTEEDANAVKAFVVGSISLSACAQRVADVTGDANANSLDARLIKRALAGELSIDDFECP